MTTTNVLPDSRLRRAKRVSFRAADGRNHVRIYCANCGKPWGSVPEEFVAFAFALCDPCGEKHGDIAGTYKEPDDVFRARVAEAMAGRPAPSPAALIAQARSELDNPNSPLSKLAREWEARVRQDL